MTRAEQKRFARELARNVMARVLENADRWPDEWDGHELRALLRDAFAEAVVGAMDPRPQWGDRRRIRAYRNECLVRGLP